MTEFYQPISPNWLISQSISFPVINIFGQGQSINRDLHNAQTKGIVAALKPVTASTNYFFLFEWCEELVNIIMTTLPWPQNKVF